MDKFKPGAILPDFNNLTKHNGEPIIDLPKRKSAMQANELRIGNYIYSDKQIVSVRSIYFHQGKHKIEWVWHLGNGVFNADDDGDLEPIPLTPEILEKAGFKNEHEDERYILGEGAYYLKNSGDITAFLIEEDMTAIEKPKIHLVTTGKWNLRAIGVNPYDNLSFDPPEDFEIPNLPLRQIEYLHELQNLIFAITGEELTINL